jgi:hypothetical protein
LPGYQKNKRQSYTFSFVSSWTIDRTLQGYILEYAAKFEVVLELLATMVNLVSKVAIVGVVFVAVLYQFVFKNLLFGIIGYGRHVRSIKDFNHISCKKVDELGLEGCEDMWLHERTGYLYMACSDSRSRTQWLPA